MRGIRPHLKVVLAGALALAACSAIGAGTNEVEPLVGANTAFAMDVYARIRATPGNIVFSPYSISAAMGMTYAGARGETARQIEQALRLPSGGTNVHRLFKLLDGALNAALTNGGVALEIANSLWPQKEDGFRSELFDLLQANYRATVRPVDFSNHAPAACATINSWVDEKTHHIIRSMAGLMDIDAATRLVVANAIYFKGFWDTQFPAGLTRRGRFSISPSQSTMAQFMTVSEYFPYFENESMQMLVMPYRQERYEMVVLLPRTDGPEGAKSEAQTPTEHVASRPKALERLENGLTPASLAQWLSEAKYQKVDVIFPRFKLSGGYNLNDVLKALGIVDAFESDRADFSGMDGQLHSLFISKLLHQVFVEVDESGTEAAAASANPLTQSIHAHFYADHPFLFIIRETSTGTILFMGRIANPQSEPVLTSEQGSAPSKPLDARINDRRTWFDGDRKTGF